jgi:hypothetical protein
MVIEVAIDVQVIKYSWPEGGCTTELAEWLLVKLPSVGRSEAFVHTPSECKWQELIDETPDALREELGEFLKAVGECETLSISTGG